MKLCRICENRLCNNWGRIHISKCCNDSYKIEYVIFSESMSAAEAIINELTEGIPRISEIRSACSRTVVTEVATYIWVKPMTMGLRGCKPDVAYVDTELPAELKETIVNCNCSLSAEVNYF